MLVSTDIFFWLFRQVRDFRTLKMVCVSAQSNTDLDEELNEIVD